MMDICGAYLKFDHQIHYFCPYFTQICCFDRFILKFCSVYFIQNYPGQFIARMIGDYGKEQDSDEIEKTFKE